MKMWFLGNFEFGMSKTMVFVGLPDRNTFTDGVAEASEPTGWIFVDFFLSLRRNSLVPVLCEFVLLLSQHRCARPGLVLCQI